MSFGKRRQIPDAKVTSTASGQVETRERDRLEAFRDALLVLLKAAGTIADAIRAEASLPMPAIVDEADPTQGPMVFKGVTEHFCFVQGGRIRHCTLSYIDPETNTVLEPSAQKQLYGLASQILELNQFCQQAELDEALGVALQSPHVPAMVDRILVGTAFFAGLFDNMVVLADASEAPPTLDEQRDNLERHMLMARDKMIEPDTLEALLPLNGWPFAGRMSTVEPHAGDYFLNNIYFTAAEATSIMALEDLVSAERSPGNQFGLVAAGARLTC